MDRREKQAKLIIKIVVYSGIAFLILVALSPILLILFSEPAEHGGDCPWIYPWCKP